MTSFLLRRLANAVLLLAGVSLLSFLFVQAAPGDYFSETRVNPQISPATLANLRSQYGLDRPVGQRYVSWMRSVASGEFGFSFAYNAPVSALLWPRVENTLTLTLLATVVAWLLALLIGIVSAARAETLADRAATAATSALIALPEILIALLLLFIALRLHWIPVGGMSSSTEQQGMSRLADRLAHLLLPTLALVLASLPVLVRHVRAAMVEALQAPHVRAARALGVPEMRRVLFHALPAAANPLISLFGLSIATLLSGSLLVEIILGWPGLGPLVLEAIFARDVFVVLGAVMLSTVLLLLGSFLADVLLFVADPRVRVRA